MAHKTLVNGTAYEIKGGKALVGGTGYAIKKGRTDSELDLDFEELVADLAKMCQPYYGYAAPVYEL